MMNRQAFSPSSFFSEEVCFSDERQAAVRKMEHMNGYSDGLLRTEDRVPLNSQMANGFVPSDYYISRGQHMKMLLGKRVVGAERSVSRSLPGAVDHGIGAKRTPNANSASYLFNNKVNHTGAQYDNGIFTSSLSDLFTQNLKLASDNLRQAHSVAANAVVTSSRSEDEVAFESLEELEAKTIGNLLPDDDDLFSGVTDGFDKIVRRNNGGDVEDLDLFSSIGGMELGEDCFSKRNSELSEQVMLEQAQFGGSKRLLQPFSSKMEQEDSDLAWQLHNPSSTRAIGVTRYDPTNHSSITESGHLQQNHLNFELQGSRNIHRRPFPELYDGLTNVHPFGSPNNISMNMSPRMREMIDGQQFHGVDSNGRPEVFCGSGNGCCHTTGRHHIWDNSHLPKPQPLMWPNSPSFINGISAAHPQQLHAVPRAQSSMLSALSPLNSHHVGSAPSIWDRRHAYAGESPDASLFHPGPLGNMRMSGNSPHPLDFVTHNMYPCTGGNCMDMPMPAKSIGLHAHHSRCIDFPARGQMGLSSFESPNERTRNRRNESSSSLADNKKQFELDIDRIASGEDKRTTLMIKNIPNKYTSKMLLAAIDEHHKGTYDFIYLPIDFKNKCNVGYAFINMIDPALIIPLYETFNGKKWEKFNSEKVASLAYARIQGKAALVSHFQNSSLMNEDKRCRPILFHTDGPNAGDQIPFPAGTNIRQRAGKTKGNTSDENNQGSPSNCQTGEDHMSSEHSSSSGSGRDSD